MSWTVATHLPTPTYTCHPPDPFHTHPAFPYACTAGLQCMFLLALVLVGWCRPPCQCPYLQCFTACLQQHLPMKWLIHRCTGSIESYHWTLKSRGIVQIIFKRTNICITSWVVPTLLWREICPCVSSVLFHCKQNILVFLHCKFVWNPACRTTTTIE